jgi:hypothetical protein
VRQLEELAERLVQYDPLFAAAVVQLIVDQLGGPPADDGPDLGRAHSFLARPDAAATGEQPTTTAEWKLEFAQKERLRQLGLLVSELLH